MEYALEHLNVSLVIVLGHQHCGAIETFISHKHDTIPNHIQCIVDYIKTEPEELALSDTAGNYFEEAVKANVLHGVHVLQNSQPVIAELIDHDKVKILGAVYNVESGEVIFTPE